MKRVAMNTDPFTREFSCYDAAMGKLLALLREE